MKKKLGFVLVGLISYLLFMLVLTPAAVWLQLAPLPAKVQLGKVQGSLWQGQIDTVALPPFYLSNVQWQLNLGALWRGQLDVALKAGDIRDDRLPFVQLNASVSPASFVLSDATVRWPISGLLSHLQLPMQVDASGVLVLSVASFTQGEPYCQQLAGKASWQQARFKSPIGWLDLRQIDGVLSCQQGNLRLVTAPDNPLALAVTADVLAGSYTLNGTLKPDSAMPKEVHEAMRFVSQPDNEGRYRISLGGQIRMQ